LILQIGPREFVFRRLQRACNDRAALIPIIVNGELARKAYVNHGA
jgi:hypothetical protein